MFRITGYSQRTQKTGERPSSNVDWVELWKCDSSQTRPLGVRRELSGRGRGGATDADSHGHIGVFGCDFQPTQPDRGGREEEERNSPVGAVMTQNGEASGL